LTDAADGTHLTAFRIRHSRGDFESHELKLLQNIQDCDNMLQSKRLGDDISQKMAPLADDGKMDYKKQQEDREADKYIRQVMTEAASLVDLPVGSASEGVDPSMSLTLGDLCSNGTSCICSRDV
jgi:hypothetical protein